MTTESQYGIDKCLFALLFHCIAFDSFVSSVLPRAADFTIAELAYLIAEYIRSIMQ